MDRVILSAEDGDPHFPKNALNQRPFMVIDEGNGESVVTANVEDVDQLIKLYLDTLDKNAFYTVEQFMNEAVVAVGICTPAGQVIDYQPVVHGSVLPARITPTEVTEALSEMNL